MRTRIAFGFIISAPTGSVAWSMWAQRPRSIKKGLWCSSANRKLTWKSREVRGRHKWMKCLGFRKVAQDSTVVHRPDYGGLPKAEWNSLEFRPHRGGDVGRPAGAGVET